MESKLHYAAKFAVFCKTHATLEVADEVAALLARIIERRFTASNLSWSTFQPLLDYSCMFAFVPGVASMLPFFYEKCNGTLKLQLYLPASQFAQLHSILSPYSSDACMSVLHGLMGGVGQAVSAWNEYQPLQEVLQVLKACIAIAREWHTFEAHVNAILAAMKNHYRLSKSFLDAIIADTGVLKSLTDSKNSAFIDWCKSRYQEAHQLGVEPAFSWRMPHASMPYYPEVEAFLRGPDASYTLRAGIYSLPSARKFVQTYCYGSMRASSTYSVQGSALGRGRDACVQLQKTKDYFNFSQRQRAIVRETNAKLRHVLANSGVTFDSAGCIVTPPIDATISSSSSASASGPVIPASLASASANKLAAQIAAALATTFGTVAPTSTTTTTSTAAATSGPAAIAAAAAVVAPASASVTTSGQKRPYACVSATNTSNSSSSSSSSRATSSSRSSAGHLRGGSSNAPGSSGGTNNNSASTGSISSPAEGIIPAAQVAVVTQYHEFWKLQTKRSVVAWSGLVGFVSTAVTALWQHWALDNFLATFKTPQAGTAIYQDLYSKQLTSGDAFTISLGSHVLREFVRSVTPEALSSNKLGRVSAADFTALGRILNQDIANLRRRASPSFPAAFATTFGKNSHPNGSNATNGRELFISRSNSRSTVNSESNDHNGSNSIAAGNNTHTATSTTSSSSNLDINTSANVAAASLSITPQEAKQFFYNCGEEDDGDKPLAMETRNSSVARTNSSSSILPSATAGLTALEKQKQKQDYDNTVRTGNAVSTCIGTPLTIKANQLSSNEPSSNPSTQSPTIGTNANATVDTSNEIYQQ